MIKLFVSIILINFLCQSKLISQLTSQKPAEPCTKPASCPPSAYPYPVTIDLPICLTFIDSGPEIASVNGCSDGRCYPPYPSYRKSAMASQLQQAQNRINCLCDKENEPCNRSVKVKFSSNKNDFRYPSKNPSANSLSVFKKQMSGVINEDCSLNCDNLYIFLNQTEEFTMASNRPAGVYSTFFVIDDYFYTDATISQFITIDAYNLLDVLNYELGSLLGLGVPQGFKEDFSSCSHDGIFDADYNYPHSLKSTFMSEEDKCMVLKKYCDPTSLYDTNTPFDYVINISNDNLYIKSPVTRDPKKVEIYTIAGQLLISVDFKQYSKRGSDIVIDLNSCISGTYYIMIYETNHKMSFSNFILVK